VKKDSSIRKITYLQLVLLHVAIGLVVFAFRSSAKFILFAAIVYFLVRIVHNTNKRDEVLLAAAYVTGFEVFSRMTGGAFTYEFAKYAVIMFLTIGMFYRGFKRRSWIYVIYLLLLIPGILFSAINLGYDSNVANAVGFNLSGPVCLGISALYCYDRRMPMSRLNGILLSLLMPIISMTVYLYLFTPSIRDVLTGTQSNFEASGGFGPNQVATILGFGMVVLFTRLFLKKQLLFNIFDLLLLAFLSYRAIVTFSRGGVITAVICALAFFVIYFLKSNVKTKATLIPKISLITLVIIVTWVFTSFTTSGLIDKRYANQDAAGREKADLSTGRLELLNSELEAFYEQPITGIGVGKVKEFRAEKTGRVSATHNELSRILSEHGISGLIALMILIFAPLTFRLRNKSNIYFYVFFLFWFFTINHSSMRIAAPAFIYGLALITVINEQKKNSIPGK
jgi:hypothetical protein